METMLLLKSFAALILVCGLILLVTFLLKKFNLTGFASLGNGKISILEKLYLNDKTQIILINKNNCEYLLLLSKDGNLLLDKSQTDIVGKN